MIDADKPFGLRAPTWRMLGIAVVMACVLMILYVTAVLSGIVTPNRPAGAPVDIFDFQIVHLVGRMIWEGQLAQAYDFQALHAAQVARTGATDLATWSYPPQFDLIAAGLGLLPQALSYFLFTALGLAGFVHAVRRLAGTYSAAVLVAIAPALFDTARIGQNGFLTGGLIGLFCLLTLQDKARAGVPLGLMVIKPHLAVGISALVLLTRSWRTMAVAALVVMLSFLAATLAFGPGIWRRFLDGAAQASDLLWQGFFPTSFMTSIFATVASLGFASGTAMVVQGAVAIAALGAIVAVKMVRAPRRTLTGVAVLVSVVISPYNYGYDLPMLGIALALLFPIVDRCGVSVEKALIFVLAWIATSWGTIYNGPDAVPSLAGLALLALVVVVLNIVRRDLAATRKEHHPRPGIRSRSGESSQFSIT